MTGAFEFRVREVAAGWSVESSTWTGPPMTRHDAIDFAEGMAKVMREVGEVVRIIIVSANGTQETWAAE